MQACAGLRLRYEDLLHVVQGRIKSLYSMYKKMTRKGVTLREVFDALALRVVVDDQNGANMQRAIEVCCSPAGILLA